MCYGLLIFDDDLLVVVFLHWQRFYFQVTFHVMSRTCLLFCFFYFTMSFLPRVLQIWESIFCPKGFFSLHFFPTILLQAAFIKASLTTSNSIRQGCKEFIMRFELSPSLFICLYHTAIFQKSINRQVLHICSRPSGNLMLALYSTRTRALIAAYAVRRLPYPLDHKGPAVYSYVNYQAINQNKTKQNKNF